MAPAYRPLDIASRQIRLLNVYPSKATSAQVSCSLTYASLEHEKVKYEALSYTWGYHDATHAISIDGEVVKVMESLDAALRRLRLADKVRSLWIDAICINQDDKDEKANQVYIMDTIYKNAVQVIVWLGEPDNGSRIAMKSLAVENFSLRNNFRIWRAQRRYGVQRGWKDGKNGQLTGEIDRSVALEAEVGMVAQLLDRPWWQRVWIVQEVILAEKIIIVCGPDQVPWGNIKRRLGVHMYGLKSTNGLHRPLRTHNGTVTDCKYHWPDGEYNLLDQMHTAWRSGELKLSLYALLYQFRRFSCTLPEDRIFAYLRLVDGEQRAGIDVDYKKPVAELYTDVARSLIAAHKHLLILNCKRESCPDLTRSQQSRLFSTLDQARFIDPQATILDSPLDKPRKGWIRLPDGWERKIEGDGIWYYDHFTGRQQRESPLQNEVFPPHISDDFQLVPARWQKGWDSLGRVKYTYAPNETPKVSNLDIPSWVPNWDAYSTRDPEPLPNLSNSDTHYWASGKNRHVHFVPTSRPDWSTLGLRGMLFDTIKVMASPWCPDAEKLPISRKGVQILEEWESIVMVEPDLCPYNGREGRYNAFWRTHVADYAGEHALPDQDQVLFDAWCDRTGWTPNIEDLEHKKLASMRHFASLPSEAMALDNMFLHVYEKQINPDLLNSWGGTIKYIFDTIKDSFAQQRYLKDRYREVRSRIYQASTNRAMFVTSKGYIGLAPWNAKEGDSVVVLLGGCTPFLLRPQGTAFTLVGEAFVYGIMGGELFGPEMGHARLRGFEIV